MGREQGRILVAGPSVDPSYARKSSGARMDGAGPPGSATSRGAAGRLAGAAACRCRHVTQKPACAALPCLLQVGVLIIGR